MQELLTGVTYILAEAGAILLILFVLLSWRIVKRKTSSRRHVKRFLQTYNEHKGENKSAIISRLETGCNMNSNEAENAVKRINASERKIYQHILNLVLGKEKDNTFEIQEEISGLSDSWLDTMKIALQHAGDGGEDKLDSAHMHKQIEFLKGENSRLSENYLHMRSRLETAVELLGNLVKEYSMLYSEGEESNQMVEAIEEELNDIKKAMQEADERAVQKQDGAPEKVE